MSSRRLLLLLFFGACLVPYTAGEDGLSVNYLFVLLPLVVAVARGSILLPPLRYLALMAMYLGIFVVASVYQIEYAAFAARRVSSFILFATMFVYMFVRIDEDMIWAFKKAVIIVSLGLSVTAVYTYVSQGGAALGGAAKDIVGTQRIGFIYIVAFWLVVLERGRTRIGGLLKLAAVFAFLIGLLLTFSRASLFALAGSVLLFGAKGVVDWLRRPTRITRRHVAAAAALVAIAYGVVWAVPATLAFFDQTFLRILLDRDELALHVGDPFYSEGYRVFLIFTVVDFANRNPFTGAGFLGVWILSLGQAGSAHNQLLDVLFRTGWLGFGGYVYLLWRLLKHLYVDERAFFWGIVGVLLYGLYHETFKESQGAFVLSFLLGAMSQSHSSYRVVDRVVGRTRSLRFSREEAIVTG